MGYFEDDTYNEDTLAEMLKLEPGLSKLKIVGVHVQEMKKNPISIDAKKVHKKNKLFERNKR
jgi:hypothetical protein